MADGDHPARTLRDGVLVFGAAWCPATRPLQRSLDAAVADGRVVEVDVDVEPALADLWQVAVLPTFIEVADGRETSRSIGARPARQLIVSERPR